MEILELLRGFGRVQLASYIIWSAFTQRKFVSSFTFDLEED